MSRSRSHPLAVTALVIGTTLASGVARASTPQATVSVHFAGCVSETGTGGACVDGTALDGATGVSLSPDGTSVYVASETSRSVSVFSRDSGTGAIAQLRGTAGDRQVPNAKISVFSLNRVSGPRSSFLGKRNDAGRTPMTGYCFVPRRMIRPSMPADAPKPEDLIRADRDSR